LPGVRINGRQNLPAIPMNLAVPTTLGKRPRDHYVNPVGWCAMQRKGGMAHCQIVLVE
jgi:hypothetical protein